MRENRNQRMSPAIARKPSAILTKELFVTLGLSPSMSCPLSSFVIVNPYSPRVHRSFHLVRHCHPVLPKSASILLLVPEEAEELCLPSEWSPSCSALLLLPSCFCSHPRCLLPNISPTEGRGCCPGKVAVTPKVSVTKLLSTCLADPPKVDFTRRKLS